MAWGYDIGTGQTGGVDERLRTVLDELWAEGQAYDAGQADRLRRRRT
jgi:hypothetical protein